MQDDVALDAGRFQHAGPAVVLAPLPLRAARQRSQEPSPVARAVRREQLQPPLNCEERNAKAGIDPSA